MINFIHKNEGFTCRQCGNINPPALGTCRNHCTKCLYSLHVDALIPGDRASECGGLMAPIRIEQSGKKGFLIVHLCQKCAKEIKNKLAEDDDWEKVCQINKF